ncbi:hypothetical protein SELMODRAFT_419735 [Selaginella moellendorffii]|uniref:Uncharacterized protein n=1 Tax=Selaginella moellendorffii TaxID=88036 RepID=D8S9V9_SELML|nr:hypothetical protein SELMODRAFT_419735 [Selaginella moellendorffii]
MVLLMLVSPMAQLSLCSSYKVVKLHGCQYSILKCFKLLPNYDADCDRVLVFKSQNDLALEVISNIASDLSNDNSVVSSSMLSNMVSELVKTPLEWFHSQKPNIQKTYYLSRFNSIIYNSDKIKILDRCLFEEAKWLEVLEHCYEVIPSIYFILVASKNGIHILENEQKHYLTMMLLECSYILRWSSISCHLVGL